MPPARLPVSRETRLLLAIVLISLSTLWVLARIRFPDRPASPNPVPPVLTQLAPPSVFEDLASAVARLEPVLEASLTVIEVDSTPSGRAAGAVRSPVLALRLREDMAIAMMDLATVPAGVDIVSHDPASRLALIRIRGNGAAAPPTWSPRRMRDPRFLVVADAVPDGVSLRPVFVGSLRSIGSPLWPGQIWAVPDRTELDAGTFLFTVEGALAGLVIEREGKPAIVPAATLTATADRLLKEGRRTRGWLGVEVQPLTPQLAAATGASVGAVVTRVDPRGPAAGQLAIADVVEAIDGRSMETREHWDAHVGRLAQGGSVVLRVRRGGDLREVRVTAAPRPAPSAGRPLGLTLRAIRRAGAEIVRVDPDSAGARAGLEPGDIITVIGDREAPTPSQVSRVFAAAPDDRPLIVAITRGEAHLVFTLEKKW